MAYKEVKNDDNKRRVMVPGSAKRVVTSRIEGKNSCTRMGPDDDIQDVRSEDGTGSGASLLPFVS